MIINNKKIIGLDIDGVVTVNSKMFNCLKKEYGDFDVNNFIHYNIADSLHHLGFINCVNDFDNDEFFVRNAEEIFLNSKPRAGIDDFLIYLNKEGFDVHFVTARNSNTRNLTFEFFHKNNLIFNPNNIHFIGSFDKGKALNDLGIRTFFEDRGETLIKLIDKNIIDKGYLINTSYNKLVKNSRIKRINTFNDLNFKRK